MSSCMKSNFLSASLVMANFIFFLFSSSFKTKTLSTEQRLDSLENHQSHSCCVMSANTSRPLPLPRSASFQIQGCLCTERAQPFPHWPLSIVLQVPTVLAPEFALSYGMSNSPCPSFAASMHDKRTHLADPAFSFKLMSWQRLHLHSINIDLTRYPPIYSSKHF